AGARVLLLAGGARDVLALREQVDPPEPEGGRTKRVARGSIGAPDVGTGHEPDLGIRVGTDHEVLGGEADAVAGIVAADAPGSAVVAAAVRPRARGEGLEVHGVRGPERRIEPARGV